MRKRKADVLDKNEWTYILRDLREHGRAMPVGYAARDCFADASSENEALADRLAAMDQMDVLPCDSEG